MPYTAEFMRTRFRREMDDPLFPGEGATPDSDSLWSDEDINDYMDQAQEELCRRIDCIPDDTSFKARFKANQTRIEVEPSITKLRSAYSTGRRKTIQASTVRDMEKGFITSDYGYLYVGQWRDRTGEIEYLLTDETEGFFRAVPIPLEADTLDLSVYRLPEQRIVDGADLVVPDKYRRQLMLKMRALAYLKQDAETFNERLANVFEGQWQVWLDETARDQKVYVGGSRMTTYGGI